MRGCVWFGAPGQARTARTRLAHENMRDTVAGGIRPDVVMYLLGAMQRFRDSVGHVGKLTEAPLVIDAPDDNFVNITGVTDYENRRQYDSLQRLLPPASRDGWMKRFLAYRQFDIQEEYKGEPGRYLAHVLERFLHSLPTVMFISLPFLAVLLKLIYIRRRRYRLVDHGIFLIHTYIFTYLYLLLYFLADRLSELTEWRILGWVKTALLFWLASYLYRSMRVFYGQSRGMTAGSLMLFLTLASLVMAMVFGSYFVYTVLKG